MGREMESCVAVVASRIPQRRGRCRILMALQISLRLPLPGCTRTAGPDQQALNTVATLLFNGPLKNRHTLKMILFRLGPFRRLLGQDPRAEGGQADHCG